MTLGCSLVAQEQNESWLSFRDFMEAQLYDPHKGFYGSGIVEFGASGDFVTSSKLSHIFGRVVTNFILAEAERLNLNRLVVVELGPGDGTLARDVVETLIECAPVVAAKLEYILVERSQALVTRQKRVLGRLGEYVSWSTVDELLRHSIRGVVLANEVFDSLPVYRVRTSDRGLEEQFVRQRRATGTIATEWRTCIDQRVQDTTHRFFDCLAADSAGRPFEVSVDAVTLLTEISGFLESGTLCILDYGIGLDQTATRCDSIRIFKDRRMAEFPQDQFTQCDITANVDFRALARIASHVGLAMRSCSSQRAYCLDYGALELISEAATNGLDASGIGAAKELIVPGGIGDWMKVLIAEKR